MVLYTFHSRDVGQVRVRLGIGELNEFVRCGRVRERLPRQIRLKDCHFGRELWAQ
jgi:hypothetical protein